MAFMRARRTLLLGTTVAVTGFVGYGRSAYALPPCPVVGLTYQCSGTYTSTLTFTADNAKVETLPGFSVNASGFAVKMLANGDLSFTDENASDIASPDNGIFIVNYGLLGGDSVTVEVNGDVEGTTTYGIYALNLGTGSSSVTANGVVNAGSNAIHVRNTNSNSTGDVSVTTGVDSVIEGGSDGIYASTFGLGVVTVEANGDVTGGSGSDGIHAAIRNSSSTAAVEVTTGANSSIEGNRYGIRTVNDGLGSTIVEANGDVSGSTKDGVFSVNTNALNTGGLTVTTGADSVIYGASTGIYASNFGLGALSVEVNGDVTSGVRDGIYAVNYNSANMSGLTVTTGKGSVIDGRNAGINAFNKGTGALSVEANGDVTGKSDNGIRAFNSNADNTDGLAVTTGERSVIDGRLFGIIASNQGTGALRVEVNGNVTGKDLDGIRASNSNVNNSSELKVTTGTDSVVDGAGNGISALNNGTGALSVEANGDVTGNTLDGIYASNLNTANTGGMTVTTGADSVIDGGRNGINAYNKGTGVLSVEANGDVTGETNSGIIARNQAGGTYLKVTTGAESLIEGNTFGIRARNYGTGELAVTANGEVTGKISDGVSAYNSANGTNLTVTTGADSVIRGNLTGIFALNYGKGELSVTADGEVTGNTLDGISAFNFVYGTNLRVTTGAGSDIYGIRYGIRARNFGTGELSVTVNGDVTGGVAGLYAYSDSYLSTIAITVGGAVQNASGLTSDLAIRATGAATIFDNEGVTTGRVNLSAFDDTFTNDGTWNVAGDSDFGAGEDYVYNNGTLNAGGTEDVDDTTTFTSLLEFHNAGTLSMVDQGKFDGSNNSDSTIIENFYGEGGRLAVDAFLGGPGSKADVLTITGDITGTTYVVVNDTNDSFATYNPDGILVAVVEGPAQASNFAMADGPVSNGLYSYDIVYEDDGATDRFLLKNFAGLHAFEVAAVVSGAQNVFFDTTQGWVERQDGLRDWHARNGFITAVADPPVAEDSKDGGLWVNIRGSKTERDAEADTAALGKSYVFDTGYDQDILSVTGGADFGTRLGSATALFGVLGGYFNSSQSLNGSTTEIDYEGGSVGAYVTILSGGFFADVLGKADFYTVDYQEADPGANSDTSNGTNLGLRADAGYRFQSGGAFLEPVASVAAVWTSIDDFDLYNSTAEPGTNDAVQIGGGARAGFDVENASFSVTGRVWDALGDGNEVGLEVPGTPVDTVSDTSFSGVFGEVSGMASYRLGSSAEAHLAGSYFFNDEQTTLAAAAGMSFNW